MLWMVLENWILYQQAPEKRFQCEIQKFKKHFDLVEFQFVIRFCRTVTAWSWSWAWVTIYLNLIISHDMLLQGTNDLGTETHIFGKLSIWAIQKWYLSFFLLGQILSYFKNEMLFNTVENVRKRWKLYLLRLTQHKLTLYCLLLSIQRALLIWDDLKQVMEPPSKVYTLTN